MIFIVIIWLCFVGYAGYYVLSVHFRRRERARFFLNLIEAGLQQGASVERTLVSAAHARDRSLGIRFNLLAAYVEQGVGLIDALRRVPFFIPPEMIGMIEAGIEAGDLRKIIPACRQILRDGAGTAWKAQNYLTVIAFGVGPVWLSIFTTLVIFVFPKFKQLGADMEVSFSGLLLPWITDHARGLIWFQTCLLVIIYGAVISYAGGPRVGSFFDKLFPGISSWVKHQVPWRRKRMQRDFSAMLCVLLDAGVPEQRAVILAAESSANYEFQSRAAEVVGDLKQGVKLTDAVGRLDRSGEFQWRLKNISHSQGGFMAAMSGWHEALDAKAFQQEQTVSQVVTTGLVFLNGALVAIVVIGVFQMLISIIDVGTLW